MRERVPWARLVLGMLVSAIAIVVVAVRVDVDEIVDAFRVARYEWLAVAGVASFASVAIRAERWRLLCKPVPLSFTRAFGILSVGAALTSLLPLRLGDVVRAYLAGEMERRSKVWALTTIVFERILDIAALLVIAILLLPFVSLPSWAVGSTQIVAVTAVVGIAAACGVWFGRETLARRLQPILLRLPGPVDRLRSIAAHAVDGLAVLNQPMRLIQAAGWSALLWLLTGFVMWATLSAFGVETSPTVAMLLVVVSAITVAVPVSPSAVGVFHAAIVETLLLVSTVSASTAASVAIAAHVLLFAPPIICGLASFWLVPGISDRLLLRRSEAEPAPARMVPDGSLPPG